VINFNNTTGKNKGKLQLTKLATFLGKTEGALRATKKRSEKELSILHLGAICEANGISEKDLEEFLKIKETQKMIEKTEEEILRLKEQVLIALELGEDPTIEQWKEKKLPVFKNDNINNTRAYLFTAYIALVTGRRLTEVLKTLELIKKEDGWYYKGVNKNGFDGGIDVKAYSLDDDYELLSKMLKQLRKDIDTSNMTNQEVNNNFRHIINSKLEKITTLKYPYEGLRELFAEIQLNS
jgi:hypothetical protein